MSNAKSSVLAKKIAAARSKTAPSSDAEDFSRDVAALLAKSSGALLEAECTATAAMTAGALSAAVSGGADPGIYYWLTDTSGEPALFVTINPGFAAMMTGRLLGGELTDISPDAPATAVDFEMAASLIDMFAGPLNALLHKTGGSSRLSSSGRRGARVLKEVLRERENLNVCNIAIDLAVDSRPAPKALSLIFSRAFLERAGLFASRAQPTKANAAEWAATLRRNLLNTEIPLAVVLERVMTSVGDLSRLQVGQVVDLDPNALTRLEIAAATSAGPAYVARGRLGSWQARKAVKLTTDVDRDFLQGL